MEGKVTISLKDYKDLEDNEFRYYELMKSIDSDSSVIEIANSHFKGRHATCYTKDDYIKNVLSDNNQYIERIDHNRLEINDLNSIIRDRNKQIDELKNRSLIRRILNK